MQCPRCGADNLPTVTACVRCGLPAYPPSGRYPYPTGGGPVVLPGLTSARGTPLATVATVLAVLGALASLGYGLYALIARRAIYLDISDDPSSVSSADAALSDTLNAVLLWVAVALVVLAMVLWLVSVVSVRRGRGGLGLTGLTLALLGGSAAVVGAVLLTGVDSATTADDGAVAYVAIGTGFLAMALGLLCGAMALHHQPLEPMSPPYGTGPYANQYSDPYGPPSGPVAP